MKRLSIKQLSFKKQIFKTIFICITFLFIGSTVYSQEKIVSVATLDDYSPYCFPKSNKKSFKEIIAPGSDSVNLQGYSWDILRESFHIQGYTIRLTVYPWKRAVYDTKIGAEDVIFPMIKNPQREGDFYFSKESVDQVNFLVYVPIDSTINWIGIESLNGLTIGQIAGWDLGKKWAENDKIKKDSITKIIQGFKMLDMKRIDGFAGYEINFDYALKSERWQTQYKKLPSFDASIEYVAGAKINLKTPSLLDDFDLGKRKIIENKTFDLISKKWGVTSISGNK